MLEWLMETIGNVLEGREVGLGRGSTRHLLGGSKENHERQDTQYCG
jgi:hypothetical protein